MQPRTAVSIFKHVRKQMPLYDRRKERVGRGEGAHCSANAECRAIAVLRPSSSNARCQAWFGTPSKHNTQHPTHHRGNIALHQPVKYNEQYSQHVVQYF